MLANLIRLLRNHMHPTEEKKTHRIALTGAKCASCVNLIEKTLQSLSGVHDAKMNFANKTVTIESEASVPESTFIDAMKELGFGATLINENSDEKLTESLEEQYYRSLVRKTIVASAVAIPLLFYGMLWHAPFVENTWHFWVDILLIFVTLGVLIYSGGHYFVGAWKAFRIHNANMDTLIAIGTGIAWLYSTIVLLTAPYIPTMAKQVYFESAVVIIALINLGAVLELRARRHTSEAIKRLLQLQPKTARLVRDGQDIDVPIETIQIGDLLRVRPGEQIPIDGVLVEGASAIDESMLTGEPIARSKKVADEVTGGTLNQSGSFVMKVNKVGKDTVLAQIIQLVQQAQNSKPTIARLADKIAAIFVPTVLIIAVITALIWFNTNIELKIAYMLVTAMAVLIIACPCALGLAVPISVMVGVGKAAEYGVLIKNAEALQQAGQLDTIVLDKTGTITKGKPEVVAIHTIGSSNEERLLTLAASLEIHSEHPLAAAIVASGKKQQLPILPVTDFISMPGLGVSGIIDSQKIFIGNYKFMQSQKISSNALQGEKFAFDAQTLVYIANEQEILGIIAIADPIKSDSVAAISRLKQLGLEIIMITGDQQATAKAIGREVGVEKIIAEVLPQEKAHEIEKLQSNNKKVGMVGDGINDAAAIAGANVGFAIGSGTDIAIESADITLMRSSLHNVADAITLSRKIMKNVKQNLFGAFIYNIIGIPIAAGILFPFTGMLLSPMLAGLAMALSSVTVVTNANRLRFTNLEKT